jgi:hypothetical protein
LNHLPPRLVVKWVNNIYVCTVSPLSRHKKKIALLAVGESKALNDKTIIYRDGRICLEIPVCVRNLRIREIFKSQQAEKQSAKFVQTVN